MFMGSLFVWSCRICISRFSVVCSSQVCQQSIDSFSSGPTWPTRFPARAGAVLSAGPGIGHMRNPRSERPARFLKVLNTIVMMVHDAINFASNSGSVFQICHSRYLVSGCTSCSAPRNAGHFLMMSHSAMRCLAFSAMRLTRSDAYQLGLVVGSIMFMLFADCLEP